MFFGPTTNFKTVWTKTLRNPCDIATLNCIFNCAFIFYLVSVFLASSCHKDQSARYCFLSQVLYWSSRPGLFESRLTLIQGLKFIEVLISLVLECCLLLMLKPMNCTRCLRHAWLLTFRIVRGIETGDGDCCPVFKESRESDRSSVPNVLAIVVFYSSAYFMYETDKLSISDFFFRLYTFFYEHLKSSRF